MMPLVSVLGCGTWLFLIEEQLYYLPPDRRRLAVSCCRAGSVLAGRGRVGAGSSYAGGVSEPGVGNGTLPAPARCGVDHAYGPWQPAWGRQLSTTPHPAWDPAEYEPQAQLLAQRGSGELLSHFKDRVGLSGGV